MSTFRTVVWSSVGKKILTGITGIFLMAFIIGHLLGNLTLFIGPDAFNHYAHFLETLLHGWFIIAFEIGLILIFLVHIVPAVTVAWLDKRRARATGYEKSVGAGGASRMTLSSKTMIYTGAAILIFVILHVRMFKYGEKTLIPLGDGHTMNDLYSLVVTSFKSLPVTIAYTVMMILLGFHLRHGFWSAFQSLGWARNSTLPLLSALGLIFAFAMALGFLIMPLWIYFFFDTPVVTAGIGGL